MTARPKRRMATDFDSLLDDMPVSFNGYALVEFAKKAEAEREARRIALGMPRGFTISEKSIPATRARRALAWRCGECGGRGVGA